MIILTEPGMTNAEIIKWTNAALKNYADFIEVTSKILETHDNVLTDLDDEPTA